MNDILIRLKEMPTVVKACTIVDENGDYNVYLNACLTLDVQRKSLLHELKHINNNDFDKRIPAHIIERVS